MSHYPCLPMGKDLSEGTLREMLRIFWETYHSQPDVLVISWLMYDDSLFELLRIVGLDHLHVHPVKGFPKYGTFLCSSEGLVYSMGA